MVCKKCESKLNNKSSAPDPFRNRAGGSLVASGSTSKVGGSTSSLGGKSAAGTSTGGVGKSTNKLLGAKARYNPIGTRCKLCKQAVSQDRAQYCQGCSYKKGICSICGKIILDNVKMYKQSVS